MCLVHPWKHWQMTKAFIAIDIAAFSLFGATRADTFPERIVLYVAALSAIAWFWSRVLRPTAKLINRTTQAVDAFEGLPEFQAKTDQRTRILEGRSAELHNGQQAILRELGIEDQVRKIDPRAYGVEDLWEPRTGPSVKPTPPDH